MSSKWPDSIDKEEFPLYYQDLYMYAVFCASKFSGHDLHTAEDIAQEILTAVYVALRSGKRIDFIRAYISTAARNRYISRLKERKSRALREGNWATEHLPADAAQAVKNPGMAPGNNIAGDIFNEHSAIGRELKLFMNEKEFQVLKFEFSDKRNEYEHIEQAIEKEPELKGLNADNYYQCKNRGSLKLKVFLFRIQPGLLGGFQNIRGKLSLLQNEISTQSPGKEMEAMTNACRLIAAHSKKYEAELELLKAANHPTQQIREVYSQLLAAVLQEPGWTKEEIRQFRQLDRQLNEKIIQEDIELFESVVFDRKPVPHGRNNNMSKVCNTLIRYFSVKDLFDSG